MSAKKLKDCFKEGENGLARHRGLRKVHDNLVMVHLKKAEHNFKAITAFAKVGFSDWSASATFYCLYHCLLALVNKFGYESRNQNCTFVFIESLIDEGKITEINKKEIKEIFDESVIEDLEHSSKIMDIRETMQYTTRTNMEKDSLENLKKRTKELFDKLRNEIEK